MGFGPFFLLEAISKDFGQTPSVVERSVGPGEGIETGARRRRGYALQGDILQQLRASRIAFQLRAVSRQLQAPGRWPDRR